MDHKLLYLVLLAGCCIYVLSRGGAPERTGVAILTLGTFLTWLAVSRGPGRYSSIEVRLFLVDVLTLAAFLALALKADRFWPIWITGLQLASVLVHLTMMMAPGVIAWAYSFALKIWAYPMLALLAGGTWRHRRRLAETGADRSWSISWRPSREIAPPASPRG